MWLGNENMKFEIYQEYAKMKKNSNSIDAIQVDCLLVFNLIQTNHKFNRYATGTTNIIVTNMDLLKILAIGMRKSTIQPSRKYIYKKHSTHY
jgi:hypothetical protein